MKLFEVEVATVVCLWAEDRRSAERKAELYLDDVMNHDSNAREIVAGVSFDADWSDEVPFGNAPEGFNNLTIEEIQDKWSGKNCDDDNEVFVPDPYTLPLPGVGI
jgi:hypothetical protein